jgi:hypothetical protein
MAFKSMSKMKTTEPSVDEVGKGMKKGGKAKMAMGGPMMPSSPLAAAAAPAMGSRAMPAAAPMPMGRRPMPARRPDPRAAMLEAAMAQRAGAGAAPMMRKKGGKAEGGAETKSEMKMDKAQDKAMIGKAFKQHDMQEHKGGKGTKLKLQAGGVPKYATGGLIQKYATGGVVNGQGGYKDGGHAKMSCSSGDGYKAMKKGGSF